VRCTKALKQGPGTEEGVYLGPVQNAMQYERVKTFFTDIEKDQLTVAVGGEIPDRPGYFIPPTIIDRPAEDSRIVTEEPFGESLSFFFLFRFSVLLSQKCHIIITTDEQ
jgi:acyl-CoA reductase-like NAD-dependent aldehyde dehydrogenase